MRKKNEFKIEHQVERKVSGEKGNSMKAAEMENVKWKPQPLNLHLFYWVKEGTKGKNIYTSIVRATLRQEKIS